MCHRGDGESERDSRHTVAFEDVSSFLDYALERARTTNYDPQSLAGIVRYLEPFQASRSGVARPRLPIGQRAARDGNEGL